MEQELDAAKKFRSLVIEHSNALDQGNHVLANKTHGKLTKLYKDKKDQDELSFFVELLQDSNEYIRHWAATFSLKQAPEIAEQTLKTLSTLPTITGLSASTTLHLWKEGKLELL